MAVRVYAVILVGLFTRLTRSEGPVEGAQHTLVRLVNNSDLIVVDFIPKALDLEIALKIDLTHYKDLRSATDGDEDGEVTAKKFSLGFDGGHFLDIITVTLLPTEEHEEGVINMESMVAENVQDYYWSKNDGILVADAQQNYQVTSFDVSNNDTLFSVTVTRPWMTCDVQDVQFLMKPVLLWWMLETSDESVKAPLVVLEYLKDENSTLAAADVPTIVPEESNGQTNKETDSTEKDGPKIDKAGKIPIGADKSTDEPKDQVETLETLKQRDFRGPMALDLPQTTLTTNGSVYFKSCRMGMKKNPEVLYECKKNDATKMQGADLFIHAMGSAINAQKIASKLTILPCRTYLDHSHINVKNLTYALRGSQAKNGQFQAFLEPTYIPLLVFLILYLG